MKSPQEKAKELTEKMFNVDLNCSKESMCMLYPHALLCAQIAIEELLEESNAIDGNYNRENYWNQVKTEIEKL